MKKIKILTILIFLITSFGVAEDSNRTEKSKVDNNITSSNSILIKLRKNLRKNLKKRSSLLKDINHKKFLKRFYRDNNYSAVWFNSEGLTQRYRELFKVIESDITLNRDGKLYRKYKTILGYIKSKERDNLHTELYLSSLYIDFLKHLIYGSINWKSFQFRLKKLRKRGINAHWVTYRPDFNISKLIHQDINRTVEEVTPKRFGYQRLLKSLKILQDLKAKGGWKKLPHFKKLKLGDKGQIVIKLRERLIASKDLNISSCDNQSSTSLFETEDSVDGDIKIQPEATFDKCLEEAVKRFQARHGLKADGIVGSSTRRALNITIDEKIEKVLLNIDRVKWLPREDNRRYIIVNIPEFMLHFIDSGKEVDKFPVIIGKKGHNTPIFKDTISYIVLNPYWKVPDGIVRREIIPKMVRNPSYLRREGLEIHTSWYEHSPKIDPYSLYWEDYYYGYSKFPYKIMQPPGPKNALGKIKFKFPNRFNVYLHDTPTKRLFKKDKRAFSHGCIRVSKPIELFENIAKINGIDINRTRKILKSKRKVQFNIKKKIPVYIIYLTAGYNDTDGVLEFRGDIYGYDKLQKRME